VGEELSSHGNACRLEEEALMPKVTNGGAAPARMRRWWWLGLGAVLVGLSGVVLVGLAYRYFTPAIPAGVIATLHCGCGINALAISADGTYLVAGGDQIEIWDLGTRKVKGTIRARTIAISLYGEEHLLACGGGDGVVELWNVRTRQQVGSFAGHKDWVLALAFSPDGSLLASGSRDGTTVLWDVKTGSQKAVFRGQKRRSDDSAFPVNGVAFSPDGSTVATAGDDMTVQLWNTGTEGNMTILSPGHQDVNAVAYSPDGNLLAAGASDGTVKVWDAKRQKEIATFRVLRLSSIRALRFAPNSRLLGVGGWSMEEEGVGEAVLLDVGTWTESADLYCGSGGVQAVDFSPDGKVFVTGSSKWTIRLWSVPVP
jgi:WD40 repeat protein